MPALVGRVLLWVCAGCSVVGGGALVVMAVVYFASTYVSELQVGGYGAMAGVVGLGIYVGGMVRGHLVLRVAAGVGAALGGNLAAWIIAFLVSLPADPGGYRGNLEDGAFGAIWALVGGFLVWRLAAGRWPAVQERRS